MNFTKNIKNYWDSAVFWATNRHPKWRMATSSAEPVSYQRAMEIFDQFAGRNDLLLGYPQEGCFSRTHLMCESIFEMGLTPKKAWAAKDDGSKYTPRAPDGQELGPWPLHVALALSVREPSGKITDLVFEPMLFDGPVNLQEWGKGLGALFINETQIKPFGKSPINYTGDYAPAITTFRALNNLSSPIHPKNVLAKYQALEIIPRKVFPSRYYRENMLPHLEKWPARSGNGWFSMDPDPQSTSPVAPNNPRNLFTAPSPHPPACD